MAHASTKRKTDMLTAALAGKDMRVLLLSSNTTADTQEDVDILSDITTLDEYDGSGASRVTLTGEQVAEDLANNRAEWTADSPWSFGSAVGAGTRPAVAVLVVEHHATPGQEKVWFYLDGGFPGGGQNGQGGPFTYTPHADGAVHLL